MQRLLAWSCGAVLLVAACDSGGVTGGEEARSAPDEEKVSVLGERVAADLSYDETVEAARAEIEDFWAAQYPVLYGTPYAAVEALVAIGPGDEVECGGGNSTYRDVKGTAFYCPTEDHVVYDDATLFPMLYEQFGPLAVATVLAHEWAHAIQRRSGLAASDATTIALELEADCFAGALVAHLRLGIDDPFDVEPSHLHAALSASLQLRDERHPVTASDARSSAFDRVNAFQEGFEQGAGHCAAFSDPTILAGVFEIPFTSRTDVRHGGSGEFRSAVADVGDDLDAYWATRIAGFEPVRLVELGRGDEPRCGGEPVPAELSVDPTGYCAADRVVLYDETGLRELYDGVGAAAAAAALSDAWARAAAESFGFSIFDDEFHLTLDCLSGTWAGDVAVATRSDALLQMSLTDLDRMVATLFAGESLRGSDRDESGFERVSGFRAGFLASVEGDVGPADSCRRFL